MNPPPLKFSYGDMCYGCYDVDQDQTALISLMCFGCKKLLCDDCTNAHEGSCKRFKHDTSAGGRGIPKSRYNSWHANKSEQLKLLLLVKMAEEEEKESALGHLGLASELRKSVEQGDDETCVELETIDKLCCSCTLLPVRYDHDGKCMVCNKPFASLEVELPLKEGADGERVHTFHRVTSEIKDPTIARGSDLVTVVRTSIVQVEEVSMDEFPSTLVCAPEKSISEVANDEKVLGDEGGNVGDEEEIERVSEDEEGKGRVLGGEGGISGDEEEIERVNDDEEGGVEEVALNEVPVPVTDLSFPLVNISDCALLVQKYSFPKNKIFFGGSKKKMPDHTCQHFKFVIIFCDFRHAEI